MGVYIDMEMPKSCEDCDLESFCDLWVEARRMSNGNRAELRHPDCPLVPVPPHGRLIDADALEAKVDYHYKHKEITQYDRDLLLHYLDVEMSPTIIPASEEGE